MDKQKRRCLAVPAAVRGVIRVSSRGDGYIDREEDAAVFISNERLNTALNKDEVEARIIGAGRRGPQGEVVRILRRAKSRFVGTLERRGTRLVLVPDDFRFYEEIAIPRPPREARPGLKALARLGAWSPGTKPTGEISRIIGAKGEHETEMRSIVLERGFSNEFPREVSREAERLRRTSGKSFARECEARTDMRGALTVTIDPTDAKDFDDALSVRPLSEREVEIGVHIADVSHYVRENTALDREARGRGFSVYLVDRTIPMLPEALSNELCSLNPHEDKLAFSALFRFTSDGVIRSRSFAKTVIRSAKRLSYDEAQRLIVRSPQSDTGVFPARSEPLRLADALGILNRIAVKLCGEKLHKGAIDFETEEVQVELDARGKPLRIFVKERLASHRLVEEWMLLANQSVARYMYERQKSRGGLAPFIYRVHDAPDPEKIELLALFVRALGHELPLRRGTVTGKDLQALFQKIAGHASEALIKTTALRAMAKAVYSTKNIGHFGLALPFYTHFTSPIRRYPDLIVHRLLAEELSGRLPSQREWRAYRAIAEEASAREIEAAEAERDSLKYKQVEYMQERIGETFEGVISGVTEWGLYVAERRTRAEGLVALRALSGDYYRLDERGYAVVGERAGKRYALGDTVRFRVKGADLERKMLDYELA